MVASASNNVDSIQISSQTLMASQYMAVQAFLNTLASFTAINKVDIPATDVTRNFLDVGFARDTFSRLDALKPLWAVRDIDRDPMPADPTAISGMLDITVPTFSTIADFQGVSPQLTLPNVPSAALPTAPTAPSVQNPALPTMPTFSLPATPTFTAVAIPSTLGLDLPTFNYAVPVSDLTAPTERFTFNEQDYHSVLSDAVKMKLLSDIENGGYGIEVADERALWDRARERTSYEANAKVEEALRAAASRGFSLPPGADFAMIAEAQQAALEKVSSIDREIALKRADMYVENRKFSLATANQVESMFINYRSAMLERSLNAAKALVELGIAVFSAKKDKFLSDLEAYKAYASVYEAKIRGELTKIELFKGQVEAAKGQIEIQRGMADIYRAQIEGVRALIDVYRTQMDGTKVLMDVERSKIEVFRAQMEGYATQVGAKNAEFALYEAQVKGQLARLSVYESDVRAYAVRVEAQKSKIASETAKVESQKAFNDAKISRYDAELKTYQVKVDRWLRLFAKNLELYKTDLALFGQTSENAGRQLDLGFKVNSTNLALESKYVDREVANLEREVGALFKLMDWRLTSAKYGTDATTNLAIAAAQQITGLTSLLKDG